MNRPYPDPVQRTTNERNEPMKAPTKKANTKKAILYARVASATDRNRDAIDRQLEQCRAKARQMGLEVTDEFIDHEISGATLDRPALHRAFDYLAKNHNVDYFISSHPTVLARDLHLAAQAELQVERRGTEVVFAEPPSSQHQVARELLRSIGEYCAAIARHDHSHAVRDGIARAKARKAAVHDE